MKYLALLTLLFSTTCAWENFYNMRWSPGDMIGCLHAGFFGPIRYKHWMLGSDNGTKVIHMLGNNHNGYIDEQNKHETPRNIFRNDKCENAGQGRLGEQAVQRARQFTGTKQDYRVVDCNCEHYVRHWADGTKLCPGVWDFEERLK